MVLFALIRLGKSDLKLVDRKKVQFDIVCTWKWL